MQHNFQPSNKASRALIIMGLIVGGLGLGYQVIFPLRNHNFANAKIVMIAYFFTGRFWLETSVNGLGISIICSAAIWCSAITKIAYEGPEDEPVEYLYT